MKRDTRTPLALAILNLLHERSMHPYEMQLLMRERGHDQVIKLKPGSLYSTMERLVKAGFIEVEETSREGRRPERTTYSITDSGKDELTLWMRDLVGTPQPDYPIFGSALAFLAAIPPLEVSGLLRIRAMRLEATLAASESMLASMTTMKLPRIFGIELEYAMAMQRAELAWVVLTIDEIESGRLAWPIFDPANPPSW